MILSDPEIQKFLAKGSTHHIIFAKVLFMKEISHFIPIICLSYLCYKVRLRKSRHANLCSRNRFFRENVVIIASSELRPGSNERYENSTFYGPIKLLIFILILNRAIGPSQKFSLDMKK